MFTQKGGAFPAPTIRSISQSPVRLRSLISFGRWLISCSGFSFNRCPRRVPQRSRRRFLPPRRNKRNNSPPRRRSALIRRYIASVLKRDFGARPSRRHRPAICWGLWPSAIRHSMSITNASVHLVGLRGILRRQSASSWARSAPYSFFAPRRLTSRPIVVSCRPSRRPISARLCPPL